MPIYQTVAIHSNQPKQISQVTADDRNRIGAISRKAQRRGVSCTEFDIDDLIDTVDRKLFAHITDPNHCLHHLLPPTLSPILRIFFNIDKYFLVRWLILVRKRNASLPETRSNVVAASRPAVVEGLSANNCMALV